MDMLSLTCPGGTWDYADGLWSFTETVRPEPAHSSLALVPAC
jgi:hypothetical protein